MQSTYEPLRNKEQDSLRTEAIVHSDDRLELPKTVAHLLGVQDGVRLSVSGSDEAVTITANIHSLAKLYIEPTSKCNLHCVECLRKTWAEVPGEMEERTFAAVAEQLEGFKHLKTVVFTGFGEPTVHNRLAAMTEALKGRRLRVELISNGTLLTESLARSLVAAGLDRLWISLDGSSEEQYSAVRVGASFGRVVGNARTAVRISDDSGGPLRLGISFVAMRGNIAQVSEIWSLAKSIGADTVLVSNVIPYCREMRESTLHSLEHPRSDMGEHTGEPQIILPRMDLDETTAAGLLKLLKMTKNVKIGNTVFASERRRCRFIAQRSMCVRWDGMVSPCLALMHPHTEYLNGYERIIEPWLLGNVSEEGLKAIWEEPANAEFREKADRFAFAPCHLCSGCELLTNNREDCFGSGYPACGSCLWASGLAQCP
jgi:MoaA/NifB/PqqE/SkfB family radical SAM enzyme